MSNLAKLRAKYGENVGVEIFFQFPDLASNERTYLEADAASGASSLSANGTNFSVDQYILIGSPGMEKTEIVKIHASTAPTSTTITLAATTSFAHSRGDLVVFIPYNQIVPERSTDSGANFSVLSTISIRPDAMETYLQRVSDASTDVYRFRFYNSTSTNYSAYSDNSTASGYAANTVHSLKRRALQDIGEQIGSVITDEFLNESLWEGRRELDQDPRVYRWSFREKFNQDIGNVIPGQWSVALPSDLRDPFSNKNVLDVRIGRNNISLDYQPLREFTDNYRGVAHSTLASSITGASTSLVPTSSGDFDESGSVVIAASSVSETLDTVAYTSNTESTATLGTVTGIADSKSAGVDVWQGAVFGDPTYYTIYDGRVYFDVPFEDALAGENVLMSYYGELVAYDSDSDTLDEPEYDMFLNWLKWKIKYRKSNGKIKSENDPDYMAWEKRKEDLIAKERTGQSVQLIPD